MSGGQILLDEFGAIILDENGNVMLSNGDGDECCCTPPDNEGPCFVRANCSFSSFFGYKYPYDSPYNRYNPQRFEFVLGGLDYKDSRPYYDPANTGFPDSFTGGSWNAPGTVRTDSSRLGGLLQTESRWLFRNVFSVSGYARYGSVHSIPLR